LIKGFKKTSKSLKKNKKTLFFHSLNILNRLNRVSILLQGDNPKLYSFDKDNKRFTQKARFEVETFRTPGKRETNPRLGTEIEEWNVLLIQIQEGAPW
jgi:hypothetical protein